MKKFKFFNECKTIQDVKRTYRELVFKFHPDLVQDEQAKEQNEKIMKEVNNEYELVFSYIKDNPFDEQEKKRNYYADVNDGYREQINKIVFIPNIFIEVCGSWVWVTGETKPVKDIIKTAGYHYASKKIAWYWHPEEEKNFNRNGKWSMEKIRDTYGSIKVEKEERVQVGR